MPHERCDMLENVITNSNTRGWARISKCLVEAIAFFSRWKGGYRSPFYLEEAHVKRDTEVESCKQLGRLCMSGTEEEKAGSQKGLNDLKLFCTCLPPWVWVDIGLVVAIHRLLKTFCMLEEFLTLWVLPPPPRSQELFFPSNLCKQGADLWPSTQRWGNSEWTRHGGALANRSSDLGLEWVALISAPADGYSVRTQGQYWPDASLFPPRTPNRHFCVKYSFEMGVTNSKSIKTQYAKITCLP